MMIKSFEGVDMNDALRKVKKELGSDAVILSSRKSERSGSPASPGVVVTAGLPQVDPPWARDLPGEPEENPEGVRLSEMDALREIIARMEREWGPGSSREIQGLLSRVGPLSAGFLASAHPPFDPVEEAGKILASCGFPEEDRQDLMEAFRLLSFQPVEWSSSQVQSLLQFLVAQKLSVAGSLFSGERQGGRPQIILFAGPTGVGKTTTIAKIAAMLVARHRRSVGLVNFDTYRIGAVEQLRIYGDLMGVPVEVVSSPNRLSGAIEHLQESEVILVDTAGRSEGGSDEMAPFLSVLRSGPSWDFRTVLVVAATQKSEDLSRTLQRFSRIRPDALVVTKVDETGSLGSLYPLLAHSRIPAAYVGTGQKVPEDIELAHGGRLAQWMIEGWSRDGSGVRT